MLAALADDGQGALVELLASNEQVLALLQVLDAQEAASDGGVVLCLAEHAKNLQFDVVALSPSCFTAGQGSRIWHNPVRAAYLAMTRARRQLAWNICSTRPLCRNRCGRHASASGSTPAAIGHSADTRADAPPGRWFAL